MDDRGEILIYKTEDGLTKIDVSMLRIPSAWCTWCMLSGEMVQSDRSHGVTAPTEQAQRAN